MSTSGKTREPSVLSHSLQDAIDAAIAEKTSATELLALMIELKMRKARVRVTKAEQKALRAAAAEYLQTSDSAVFSNAVKRKRNIELSVNARDWRLLESIVSKAVNGTISHSVREMARSLEPSVRSEALLRALSVDADIAEFRERIAKRWRQPFEQFAVFRQLAAHIGELSVSRMQEKGIWATSRLANALALLHSRAILVSGEVEALIRAGFADGAMARWRSLHEIAVTMAFLGEHGEATAERYLAHLAPATLKAARQHEVYRRKLGERTLGKRFLTQLSNEVAALEAKYGKEFKDDYGWARPELSGRPLNFSEIEKAVKLDYMRPFYKLASEQVHASVRGAAVRTGLVENELKEGGMLAGPSDYGFSDAGQNSGKSLLTATVTLLRIEPTIDTNVLSLVLASWLSPLRTSFAMTQHRLAVRVLKSRSRTHR